MRRYVNQLEPVGGSESGKLCGSTASPWRGSEARRCVNQAAGEAPRVGRCVNQREPLERHREPEGVWVNASPGEAARAGRCVALERHRDWEVCESTRATGEAPRIGRSVGQREPRRSSENGKECGPGEAPRAERCVNKRELLERHREREGVWVNASPWRGRESWGVALER